MDTCLETPSNSSCLAPLELEVCDWIALIHFSPRRAIKVRNIRRVAVNRGLLERSIRSAHQGSRKGWHKLIRCILIIKTTLLKMPASTPVCAIDTSDTSSYDMPSYAPASVPQAAWQEVLDHENDIHDVLIIGAGPCGLAAAARIREQSPSAMFTDEEHRRFHWLSKHGGRVALKRTKTGRVTSARPSSPNPEAYKMAVLDESDGKWLGRWKRLFSAFDISHLRSPMLWHIDPQDRDSLLSYGHMQGRADELVEIRGCVGKEMSKHQKKKRSQFSGGR